MRYALFLLSSFLVVISYCCEHIVVLIHCGVVATIRLTEARRSDNWMRATQEACRRCRVRRRGGGGRSTERGLLPTASDPKAVPTYVRKVGKGIALRRKGRGLSCSE